MARGFNSDQDYQRFAHAVAYDSRFVRSRENERFLKTLLEQARDKVEVLEKGGYLWRAQIGHDWMLVVEDVEDDAEEPFEVPDPFPPHRMKPLPNRAVEGRANPKGIPYLYLATHRDTAMAEVRPWIESIISLGQFEVNRELQVVNCTLHGEYQWFLGHETPSECWDDNVWSEVDDAFSRPVTTGDDTAAYAPTQVLAELFKSGGFDGVAYKSALGEGLNVVLFDLDAASLTSCGLFRLKRLKFDFREDGNPYFVQNNANANAESG